MEHLFRISGFGTMMVQPGLPADASCPLLYGSSAYHIQNALGRLILQEWGGRHYGIQYLRYQFYARVSLQQYYRQGSLHFRLMLSGRLTHRLRRQGRLHLREKQFAIFFEEGAELHTQPLANRRYECLDLFVSPRYLERLPLRFPALPEAPGKEMIRLLAIPLQADQQVLDLVEKLFQAPFTRQTGQLFLEERVNQLMMLLLEQAFGPASQVPPLTAAEQDAVCRARAIIESNFRLHHNISQVARRVGLNESRLKQGFRICFGMGLFDCLIEARMRAAHELVLQSDYSIKAIAIMVGYRQLSSFSNAFKRYFGQGPATLRHSK